MDWKQERDRGFEKDFAQREERAFRAAAHRNGLLARWAALKMELTHRDAERYVQSLVTGDVAHLRGRGIVDRIIQDLWAAGVGVSEHEVRAEFDRLDHEANAEIRGA
jgi:hypothetical protein